MQDEISRAEAANRELQQAVAPRWFPQFHIAPKAGWLNDPNGLIYFKGEYHVFFQHNPYDATWGPMHWGHVSSRDLVRWKHEPLALAPSLAEDRDGVFSGTAVVSLDEQELVVFYTGNRFHDGKTPGDGDHQVQMAARSIDGRKFQKIGVVIEGQHPMAQFRDPKVWRHDESWFMIVAAQSAEGRGQIWQYRSSDLSEWIFDRVLYEDPRADVYMLECPDLFYLEGRWVLVYCPLGLRPNGYAFRNGHSVGYVVGDWSPEFGFSAETPYQTADWGHNYYAPQTLLDNQGRRISFAWIGSFTTRVASQESDGWTGQLSLPRVLTIGQDSQVAALPLPELEELRADAQTWRDFSLAADETLDLATNTDCYEIELVIELDQSSAERFGFLVHLTPSGEHTYVGYDDLSKRVFLDRRATGNGVRGYRAMPLKSQDPNLGLRIFVDRGSVEVFLSDGTATMTSFSFPSEGAQKLALSSEAGDLKVDRLTVYSLESLWLA